MRAEAPRLARQLNRARALSQHLQLTSPAISSPSPHAVWPDALYDRTSPQLNDGDAIVRQARHFALPRAPASLERCLGHVEPPPIQPLHRDRGVEQDLLIAAPLQVWYHTHL